MHCFQVAVIFWGECLVENMDIASCRILFLVKALQYLYRKKTNKKYKIKGLESCIAKGPHPNKVHFMFHKDAKSKKNQKCEYHLW